MSGLVGNAAARAARAGGSVVRSVTRSSTARPPGGGATASGWLAVTVLREASEIDTGALPVPLAELGDRIEVRVRQAPGSKGAELMARLQDPLASGGKASRLAGADEQAEVRSALRRAKQLLEVGEVLAVDPVPHGERTETPGGELLERWTETAPGGGVR